MSNRTLTHRKAQMSDLDAIEALIDRAIADLQTPFLDEKQIEASRTIMGVDTQLIEDRTYFVVMIGGELAGCGGWSPRATLYGGDETPGRNGAYLNPDHDPARIRAMYTHPAYARRGVGRRVLSLCEIAAQEAGFQHVKLVSTLAGEPLYRACGYVAVERFTDDRGGTPVPLVGMRKRLSP